MSRSLPWPRSLLLENRCGLRYSIPKVHPKAQRALHMPLHEASSSRSERLRALHDDRRGYPERLYTTEILPLNNANIRFVGEGEEPLFEAEVEVEDKTHTDFLEQASHALHNSHLVAIPTETVYGLAGNALDPDAVGKIFSAKGRPADNPLIVHISDKRMLRDLCPPNFQLSAVYGALIDAFWPGPLTLLVPSNETQVPSVVRCGLPTLGVRMPSHPVARALIAHSKLPLAAPSANVSGRPSPTTSDHVYSDMTGGDQSKGRIPYVLDGGPCRVGLESTVVDGITAPGQLRILRPGGVSVEEIYAVLEKEDLLAQGSETSPQKVEVQVYGKELVRDSSLESNPTTPGMKYKHYSPDATVILLIARNHGTAKSVENVKGPQDVIEEQVRCFQKEENRHVNVGLMSKDGSALTMQLLGSSIPTARLWSPVQKDRYSLYGYSLGDLSSPGEAAHRLFDGLRTLDEGFMGIPRCDLIFVEAPDDDSGVGLAFLNRIQKAASQTIVIAM